MKTSRHLETLLFLSSTVVGISCSGASGSNPGSGGDIGVGGSSSATDTGGTTSTGAGGEADGGNGTGGMLSTGGSLTGSGTGGAAASGGAVATGGASQAAGAATIGGANPTGGSKAAGGTPATGGSKATTGGVTSAGGAPATGGSKSTGGAATGGASVVAGGSSGCGTHSWACWPMPNPVSMGLPNPASYTDKGDGTVQDNVTGLLWQQTVSTPTYSSADATTYCAGLALAGSGWRVPTRIELESITDHTRTSPAINVTAFPGTPAAFFLTLTPWAEKTPPVWGTNFYEGLSSNNVTPPARLRCVRGNGDGDLPNTPPPNQYTLVATGEVQDNYTKLVWEQATHQPAMDYATAVATCSGLTTNGDSFRLPTVNELSTLVEDSRVAPAINQTMFPDTVWGSGDTYYYWAQDAWAGSTAGTGWGLNYNDGYTGHGRTDLVVRCVKK